MDQEGAVGGEWSFLNGRDTYQSMRDRCTFPVNTLTIFGSSRHARGAHGTGILPFAALSIRSTLVYSAFTRRYTNL